MGNNRIIVKWRIRGSLAIDGIAHRRAVGDEDIVEARLARKMEICGQVKIVGAENKMKSRRLPQDLDIADVIPESEEEADELNES